MIANCVNFISPVHSCSRLSFLLHLKPSGDMEPEAMRQDHSCTLRVNHEGHVPITVALRTNQINLLHVAWFNQYSSILFFVSFFWWKKIKIHTGKNVHGKGCSSRVTKNNLFLTSLTVTIKLQNVLSEVSKKKKTQQIKKKINHFLVYWKQCQYL